MLLSSYGRCGTENAGNAKGCKAEIPILWPPDWKSWLIGKDSDAGRDWGQEEKGMTEDEMAGWHHWLDVRESEWTPSWWWTGRPGVLRFMGSQIVGHDWATELNWTFMDPSLLASVILSCFLCRSCDLTPYEVSSVIEFFWPLYFPVTGICYQ